MSVAVRVEHLSKEYRLGVIGNGSLYKDIQSWIAKKRGKPDPWVPFDERSRIGREHFWALNFDVCDSCRLSDFECARKMEAAVPNQSYHASH